MTARPSADGPRLVVLYDIGSASPVEIARAVTTVAPPLFVVGNSPHAEATFPVFAALGPSIRWQGAERTAQVIRAESATSGVLTFSDRMVVPASELAERLGHPFHSRAAAVRLTNKDEQRRALSGTPAGSVRFRRLRSGDDTQAAVRSVGLPAVLKPTVGEASRDTFLIEAAAQVEAIVDHKPQVSYQLESLLRGRDCWPLGDYVSVESLISRGRVTHLAVTGKLLLIPPFRETGQFWPALLDPDEERGVLQLAETALTVLGAREGLAHTEIKLTAEGPRIIEVNGRLGGFINELAKRRMGCDLITLSAEALLSEVDPPRSPASDRIDYQFNNLPPEDVVQLTRVDGADGVRDIPGLVSYEQTLRPPAKLAPGVATQHLDNLCGVAADVDEMLETVRSAVARLVFHFRTSDGEPVSIRGTDLPSAAALPLRDSAVGGHGKAAGNS